MTDSDTRDPGDAIQRVAGHPRLTNMAASVRARLTALAHAQGEETEYMLTRYALERFLFRLGRSQYAGEFMLKGAFLFALWEDRPHRATRDLDLLGFGANEVDRIARIFREFCMLPVDEDGLTFLPESIRARPIREGQEYGGIRVQLEAALGTARLRAQVDVGFGDIVTPPPQTVDFPTLLDLPAPRLRVYPREAVVAEKFEAMVRLGMTNSRMKDFYDLLVLSQLFAFDGPPLAAAIRATFARRNADLPLEPPVALTDEFAGNSGRQDTWRAFLKRGKLDASGLTLDAVTEELRRFLLPLVSALAAGAVFDRRWVPDSTTWEPRAE